MIYEFFFWKSNPVQAGSPLFAPHTLAHIFCHDELDVGPSRSFPVFYREVFEPTHNTVLFCMFPFFLDYKAVFLFLVKYFHT